jgi:transcriptional regulator with XRE-family HTH domain
LIKLNKTYTHFQRIADFLFSEQRGEIMAKKVGRPKKYSEEKEFANKVQHYFDSITITELAWDYKVVGQDGEGKDIFDRVPRLNNAGEQIKITRYVENPSILKLCEHLGMTRETLCQYEKDPMFSDTIKKAKAKIEQYLEDQLYRKDQVTGIIFNLKNNFGWKDKQEIEATGKDGGAITIEFKGQLDEWSR